MFFLLLIKGTSDLEKVGSDQAVVDAVEVGGGFREEAITS